jgi:hypothetical protein
MDQYQRLSLTGYLIMNLRTVDLGDVPSPFSRLRCHGMADEGENRSQRQQS